MTFLTGGDNYMHKVKNYFSNISTRTIVIILSSILFIILGIYLYNNNYKSQMNTSYSANNEHTYVSGSGNSSQVELLFFYVDWCPHCKTAKPVWEDLKAEYENKTINGYTIIFNEINCTNESPEIEKIINTYKIEGYPTIKLLKDGQVIEYDAKPTKETLEQFLNTTL